jgi:hypothetical protein
MFHRVAGTHQAKATGSFAERIRPARAGIGSCRERGTAANLQTDSPVRYHKLPSCRTNCHLRGLGTFGFKLRDVVYNFRR